MPKLTKAQIKKLKEAVTHGGHFVRGSLSRKTVTALEAGGFIEQRHDSVYGLRWFITEKGRKAVEGE